MPKLSVKLIVAAACIAAASFTVSAQKTITKGETPKPTKTPQLTVLPDLSMRTAIYFTGDKTDSIDLAHDKYVEQGSGMNLSTAQGKANGDGTFSFNLGVLVFREKGVLKDPLTTFFQFQALGGSIGNTVFFPANEQVVQAVFAVKLKVGDNQVTAYVDPEHKTTESNENNNSITVTFHISAPPPIRHQ